MGDYRIPKQFVKTHNVFRKASVTDNTLSNNPAYYVPQVQLAIRGELVFIYEDNGCIITATSTGVTVDKESGLFTINVPRDTYLFTIRIAGTSHDIDTDYAVKVQVVYEATSTDNPILEGMEPIGLTVWDYSLISNSGEDASESYFARKEDKLWQCTLSSTDVDSQVQLEVKVEDMNYDNWKIDIGF